MTVASQARRATPTQLAELGGDPLAPRCRDWLTDWTNGAVTMERDRLRSGVTARWGDRTAFVGDLELLEMGAMRVLCTLLHRLGWTDGSRR